MASFQPLTDLHQHPPSSTRTVLLTTSALLSAAVVFVVGDKINDNNGGGNGGGGGSIESHPQQSKWYLRNYGLGPRRDVRLATRCLAPDNCYTRVKFRPGPGGGIASDGSRSTATTTRSVVSELNFGGGGGGGGGSLVVACGPRVSLYGASKPGGGMSLLVRALRAGSGSGPGGKKQQRVGEDNDDDNKDDVDLFGGKGKAIGLGSDHGDNDYDLVAIDPDRNIPTGGKVATCALYRSDSRLIAIGTEGGGVQVCDAQSRATLRTFNSTETTRDILSVAWMWDGKRVVVGGRWTCLGVECGRGRSGTRWEWGRDDAPWTWG